MPGRVCVKNDAMAPNGTPTSVPRTVRERVLGDAGGWRGVLVKSRSRTKLTQPLIALCRI